MSNSLNTTIWTQEQRMRMHDAYRKWVQCCTEPEYEQVFNLREQIAPGRVCSIIKLARACLARQELLAGLPASLVQLMRERNLLPASSCVSSHAR